MAWLAFGILGVLLIGFAYAAGEWQKRALFWERAYLEKAANLELLLTGIEEEFGDRLVRVFPREAGQQEVFH